MEDLPSNINGYSIFALNQLANSTIHGAMGDLHKPIYLYMSRITLDFSGGECSMGKFLGIHVYNVVYTGAEACKDIFHTLNTTLLEKVSGGAF